VVGGAAVVGGVVVVGAAVVEGVLVVAGTVVLRRRNGNLVSAAGGGGSAHEEATTGHEQDHNTNANPSNGSPADDQGGFRGVRTVTHAVTSARQASRAMRVKVLRHSSMPTASSGRGDSSSMALLCGEPPVNLVKDT
jgi:hypothetical protein